MAEDNVIQLLRDAIVGKKPLELKESTLVIDGMEIPLDTLTIYKSQKGTGAYYTLEQAYLLYVNRELPHGKYIAELRGKGAVSFVDRKDLLAYLSGEIEKSKSLRAPKVQKKPTPSIAPPTVPNSVTSATAAVDNVVPMDVNEQAPTARAPAPPSVSEARPPPLPSMPPPPPPSAPPAPPTTTTTAQSMVKEDAAADDAISESPKTPEGAPPPDVLRRARARRAKAELTPLDRAVLDDKEANKKLLATLDDEPTRSLLHQEKALRTRSSVLRTGLRRGTKTHTGASVGADHTPLTQMVKDVQYIFRLDKEFVDVQRDKAVAAGREEQRRTYDRYQVTQDKFWRERVGGDLQLGGGGLADTPAPQARSRSMTGASASAAAANGTDSLKRRAGKEGAPAAKRARSGASGGAGAAAGGGGVSSMPIILVPSKQDAVVTLRNVKALLEDGRYEPSAKLKRPSGVVTVRAPNSGAEFVVVDNPRRLARDDWVRVVAAVVLDTEWQFKDWLWPMPVDSFTNMRGFFVYFDDEKVAPIVNTWAVKKLVLSRNKRHLDANVRVKFWEEVLRFVRLHKTGIFV